MTLGGLGVEPLADLAGTGEANGLERLGVYQGAAERAAGAGDEVDDALGDAGLVTGLDDAPGTERRGRGRAS